MNTMHTLRYEERYSFSRYFPRHGTFYRRDFFHPCSSCERLIFFIKVYDVSKFLNRHPGGKDMLLMGAGRDSTVVFEAYHSFSDCATK